MPACQSPWREDKQLGGLTLDPSKTEKTLRTTAVNHPCPDPPLLDYSDVGRPPEFNALCVGGPEKNNIWARASSMRSPR